MSISLKWESFGNAWIKHGHTIKKKKTTAHRCEHTGFSSSSFTLQTRERNKAPKWRSRGFPHWKVEGKERKGKVIFNLFSSWLALLLPIRLLTGKSRETRAGAVSIYRPCARQFAQFQAPANTHGFPRAPILPPAPHAWGTKGPRCCSAAFQRGIFSSKLTGKETGAGELREEKW